jgi:hypothetical protein
MNNHKTLSFLVTTAILSVALLTTPANAETLVAGWDSSSLAPTQLDPNIAASVQATTQHNAWGSWNFNDQGASNDGTYGNLSTTVASASTAYTGSGKNLSLNRSNGSLVFTLTNNYGVDLTMEGFYFDSIHRFSDSADTWTLTPSGAISGTAVGGSLASVTSMSAATAAQRDKGVDLSGLTDNVWEAGANAVFTLAFTGATNSSSGGGQELVVDNIGVTVVEVPEPSSAILIGLAGTGLFFIRRRKR